METGKYELVIIWEIPVADTTEYNDKDIWEYDTREEAEEAEKCMHKVLGNQIQWSCVRPQYAK